MKKELLIGVFVILLLIPLISAPPQVQLNTGDKGLEIKYPAYEFVQQHGSFTLHTHVFNKSDGLLVTNSTTSCILHLYYPNGSHLLERNMSFDSNNIDFELFISKGNFSVLGIHAYIIQCDATSIGGFVSGMFDVTPSGIELTEGRSITYFILILGSLFIFILCLYASIIIPFKNSRGSLGEIIKVQYLKYFKILFMSLTYIVLLWVFNLFHVLSSNFAVLTQYTNYFALIFQVLNAIVFPVFVFIFVGTLFLLWKDLKLENLLMRGLNER